MTNYPGFINIPNTGVIYVLDCAEKHGYQPDDASWSNLGQGAPEAGPLEGAPKRISDINIQHGQNEYAPVAGQTCLRQKIADLYNAMYRKGKASQYTYENVSISGGGRIALTRAVASLGNINMGHLVPDYTAYAELLSMQKSITPIPLLLFPEEKYQINADELQKQIIGLGLRAMLLSNPCNPTGQLIIDQSLKRVVDLAREYNCSFIMDEFYSHYIYDIEANHTDPKTLSAAEFIEDVNKDPIIIINGLTKNWRYPGWRLGWTLGPKDIIHSIASAGSFLDGGANNPLQYAAMPLLEPDHIQQEMIALQKHFQEKRDYTQKRLEQLGIMIEATPQGTFYLWANLSNLPAPLNNAMEFFTAGLQHKVITVPGAFFDINPGGKRKNTRFSEYCRISFGPEMRVLQQGLDAIERVIAAAKSPTRAKP